LYLSLSFKRRGKKERERRNTSLSESLEIVEGLEEGEKN
jgi:hypothetical protein